MASSSDGEHPTRTRTPTSSGWNSCAGRSAEDNAETACSRIIAEGLGDDSVEDDVALVVYAVRCERPADAAAQYAGSAGSSVSAAPMRAAAESRPRVIGTGPVTAASPYGGMLP